MASKNAPAVPRRLYADFCNKIGTKRTTSDVRLEFRCWVNSGKHLLAVSFSGFDPTATSPLRHPGHAQALIHAFAPSKEIRIVAEPDSTEAANGEAWIERQSGLCGSTRLIEQPELR